MKKENPDNALSWWNKQSKHRKTLLYQQYRFGVGLQNDSIHRVSNYEIHEMYTRAKHIVSSNRDSNN